MQLPRNKNIGGGEPKSKTKKVNPCPKLVFRAWLMKNDHAVMSVLSLNVTSVLVTSVLVIVSKNVTNWLAVLDENDVD